MAKKAVAHEVTPEAVRAATVIHDRYDAWAASDRLLERTRSEFEGWDIDCCHAKAVIVNSLYSTNVYAIWQMAQHVRSVMEGGGLGLAPDELVERIAALPKADGSGVLKHFVSFASKLCHFFVDEERFPILDWYADRMLKFFLGPEYEWDEDHPYGSHVANFGRLRQRPGLDAFAPREIDRLLWVGGQYREWVKKPDGSTNSGLKALFVDGDPDVKAAVAAIAACVLDGVNSGVNSLQAEELTHEHVLAAIVALEQGAGQEYGEPKKYWLVYKDRWYPPKAVYGLAVGEMTGVPLEPGDFVGGKGTSCHKALEALGFAIIEQDEKH